ncbi:MAG: LSU ribosomal protein L20p, partial [uncultured Acetobacteraceae bacterium]
GSRQTGRHRPCPAQEGPQARQGLCRSVFNFFPPRAGAGREGAAVCLPRPAQPQARLPGSVDPAHQRRDPGARDDLFPLHGRHQSGGDRDRPQGDGDHRFRRPHGLRFAGGEGQGRRSGSAGRGPATGL